MGQSSSIHNPLQLSPELLQKYVLTIFGNNDDNFSEGLIAQPVKAIVQQLNQNPMFMVDSEKMTKVNKTLLSIFYQPPKVFNRQMLKMVNYICWKLEKIMQSRALIMVKREDWKQCLDIANFLMIFSDQKTASVISSLSVRSDLHFQTKQLVREFQKENGDFQNTGDLIQKVPPGELERIQKCFRISLTTMIKLRMQFLSRSEFTLKIISLLEHSCFMLYLKIFFSAVHHVTVSKRARSEHFKANLTIGAYFLAAGVSLSIPSIYQSAIIFIDALLQKNKQAPKNITVLPSHLFKNLPIVSSTSLYDYILFYILYTLTYIKENQQTFIRFTCNRIMSLKLAQTLVSQRAARSIQITFYLEGLCIQVKAGQIERAFLTEIAAAYLKDPSVDDNDNTHIQSITSPVLEKFREGAKFTYNLNFAHKKYKITTEEVVTELANDENTFQKQFRLYCQKYIYHVILRKQVFSHFDDKQIWAQIVRNLSQIQEERNEQEKIVSPMREENMVEKPKSMQKVSYREKQHEEAQQLEEHSQLQEGIQNKEVARENVEGNYNKQQQQQQQESGDNKDSLKD